MATKKLTPKQIDRVKALAEKACVRGPFNPYEAKAVREAIKIKKTVLKTSEREIDALDKILTIIAPPKEE